MTFVEAERGKVAFAEKISIAHNRPNLTFDVSD
jgi:hypothetical protein